jgi:catechol 2,3-dioxygenase
VRLGHVELVVTDLEASRSFYVDVLGLIEHATAGGRTYLRAAEEFDAWSLALVEGDRAAVGHVGLRVGATEELERLERLHQDLGLATTRVAANAEPGQGEAVRVLAPGGHPIEFYFDFEEIELPAPPELPLPMRRTHLFKGEPPTRLDHVNFRANDVPAALAYWHALGLRASEQWLEPDGSIRIAWLRATGWKSHDVAVGPGASAGLHHVAYAVVNELSLIRFTDRLGDAGWIDALEYGPSRHGATNALCMYVRDPSGNRVELYTGDYVRDLDRPPVVWTSEAYARRGHSWWGQPAPPSFQEFSPRSDAPWPGGADA